MVSGQIPDVSEADAAYGLPDGPVDPRKKGYEVGYDVKTAFMRSGTDIFATVRPKPLYLLPLKRWREVKRQMAWKAQQAAHGLPEAGKVSSETAQKCVAENKHIAQSLVNVCSLYSYEKMVDARKANGNMDNVAPGRPRSQDQRQPEIFEHFQECAARGGARGEGFGE